MATTLKSLRAKHERAQLALEIASMQRETERFETIGRLAVDPNARGNLMEAWGDLLDPKDYLSDVEGFGPSFVSGGDANARKDGAERPFIETDSDLQMIRSQARNLLRVSPSARCAMNNLTSYILGNGFEYSVSDKDGKPKEQSALAKSIGLIVDEFLTANQWDLIGEPEALRRAYRDGECFISLFKQRNGIASVRFVEPEYVVEPTDKRAIEDREGLGNDPIDWNFGVASACDDVQTVYGYHVQWPNSPANFDFYDTRRMVHCKMGVDSTVKRGISEYYSVIQYLTDGAKLLRNTVKGAAVLAAIAAITEHPPGTSKDAVESLRSGGSFATRDDTTMNGGTAKTRYFKKFEPGTIMHAPNGRVMHPGPLSGNSMGESCVAIEQAVLRIAGSNWCMPEYMISGDASNANYASTLVAESPFVKYCERMQRFFSWTFEEILWRVIEIAIETGRISSAYGIDELKKLITIKIEPPQVSSRNAVEETTRRQTLSQAGLLSDETWAAQEGLDYDQEIAGGAGKVPAPGEVPPAGTISGVPTMESADPIKLARQLLWGDYPGKKNARPG
jgi:hypothetical protein